MSQKGWLRREPVDIQPDTPRFLDRFVAVQFENGYRPHELAAVAGLNADEFARLYLLDGGRPRLSAVPK